MAAKKYTIPVPRTYGAPTDPGTKINNTANGTNGPANATSHAARVEANIRAHTSTPAQRAANVAAHASTLLNVLQMRYSTCQRHNDLQIIHSMLLKNQ